MCLVLLHKFVAAESTSSLLSPHPQLPVTCSKNYCTTKSVAKMDLLSRLILMYLCRKKVHNVSILHVFTCICSLL
jgi:hypothetical protein